MKRNGRVMKRKKFLATAAGIAASIATSKIALAQEGGPLTPQVVAARIQSLRQPLQALIMELSAGPRLRGNGPNLLRQADHFLAQAFEFFLKAPVT